MCCKRDCWHARRVAITPAGLLLCAMVVLAVMPRKPER